MKNNDKTNEQLLDEIGKLRDKITNFEKIETERLPAEQAGKRAEEEIRLLQTITQAIAESQDLHSALEVTLRKVAEATRWDFGEVWLPNSARTALEYSSAGFNSNKDLEEFRRLSEGFTFLPNVGLPGRVWSSQQAEWIPDVSTVPDTSFKRIQLALDFGLKAGFGVPIINDERVLAVLVFFMFESRDEDRRLIELVSTVAAQLGLVIQRKQAEEVLRESEEKFKTLVEYINVIPWRFDLKKNQFTFIGKQVERILGCPVESWTDMDSWSNRIHPDDRLTSIEFCMIATKKGEDHDFEYRFVATNGNIIWLRDIVTVRKDEEGVPFELIGYMVNITERKQAEEKLINRNKELELFNEVTVGRELKMIELKKEINELLEKSGEKPKYKIII